MKKPYMHLNLPMVRGITKNPQDCFENFDIDKRMLFRDAGCTLLSSDVHNWFRDKFKIFPFLGLLWSWPQWSESDEIYHVDFYGKDGELDASSQYTFAMNLLIQGEPSATEFSNLEDSVQIPPQEVEKIRDHEEKTTGYRGGNKVVFYDRTPDWSSSIRKNYPMMINVRVPHRVNQSYQGDTRWTYSIRFINQDTSQISWQQAVDIFKKYEID